MKLSIALLLPSELEEDLGLLRGSLPSVDWVQPHQTFLNLRSLGEITDGRLLEDLDFALARLRWSPFSLSLKEVQLLEAPVRDKSAPDRLACGVSPQDSLLQLRQRIDGQLRESDFTPPRHKLRPHVTIGRLDNNRREEVAHWVQRHNLFHSREILVDRLHVLEHFEADGAPAILPVASYGHDGAFYDLLEDRRANPFGEEEVS